MTAYQRNMYTVCCVLALLIVGSVRAAKPVIDCSRIRGVCYGITPEERARRELGYGSRVGLNTVRVGLSPRGYEREGERYIKRIVDFVRVCDSCGYKSMPILFNGNMLDPKTIQPEAYEAADRFTTAVISALKGEAGLLMFDMMNEPLCNDYIAKAPNNDVRNTRKEETWAFLRREIDLAEKLAPDCLFTVGYTTAWEIEASTAEKLDILSFHDYGDLRESIRNNYELAKQWGEKLGKPVIQTETGCLARANAYEMALQFCHEYKMGWVLFNLIIAGRCIDEHGIFYPDGTIRDAGTISAMFGCFRNRGLDSAIVPPNPNREGKADRALRMIREALKEYTADAFDYRRSDKKKLLDACEVAANLLEACELVPMAELPTAKIAAFRKDPNADLWSIRKLAYDLANRLKEVCQIVD
ncbi:MAG: cellulase family glycosylhydrolase [Kiritimatiellae bacterium]|nr:cellulase family glycosylhydrolase [Kiritimatiellia bacterium]